MKLVAVWVLAFFCSLLPSAFAQQAPWGRADIPISSRDRVYAADQTSNTVSVIDPAANKLLGVIRLGDPVPGALSALYKGQLLVHGLGYSPDSKHSPSFDRCCNSKCRDACHPTVARCEHELLKRRFSI